MRIAIIGGGLGGLAAALFLEDAGLEATVYEQTPALHEVGERNSAKYELFQRRSISFR
jgi:2-polyprenyl-6-methoxyphenol hydroxylase-like FAD-dependent oxidoreductase